MDTILVVVDHRSSSRSFTPKGYIHQTYSEDCYDPRFLLLFHLQLPHCFHRYQQYYCVTCRIERTTGDESFRYVETSSVDGLVPDTSPWHTFPYFNEEGSKVKQSKDHHENLDSQIENAPSVR